MKKTARDKGSGRVRHIALALAAALTTALSPTAVLSQDCAICGLVDRLDPGRIVSVIRSLSGEDSVQVGSGKALIYTRYSYSPVKSIATGYLAGMAAQYGYEPELRRFVLTVDRPDLTGLCLSAGADTAWAASMEGDIFMSTSSGAWPGFAQVTTLEGRIFELVRGRPGMICAVGRKTGSSFGKILSSRDGGYTWRTDYDGSISRDNYQFNTVSFWENGFGFAAGHYGSLVITAEWGRSWWAAAGPAQFDYININGSEMTGPTHLWVACDRGYVFESRDFGSSWTGTQLSASFARLADIDFYDEKRGVVVGDGVVFRTSDGGESWQETSHPSSLEAVTMIDSLRVLASGSGGDIWRSVDGGALWSVLDAGCGETDDVSCLEVGSDGSIWTAGRDRLARVEEPWSGAPGCRSYQQADTTFGTNIVFTRRGWRHPERKVLLCGHYDSINRETDPMVCAPGADDNASGTSIVLECARVLSSAPVEKTVEFVLFDGEELGLIGSGAFVAAIDSGQTYEAVINIDMVGADYGGDGMIALGAIDGTADTVLVDRLMISSESYAVYNQLDWRYRNTSDQPMSDDLSFKGVLDVPAVTLIESGFRDNPHYHDCSDLVDYVDPEYMLDVARIVLAASADMAGLATEPSSQVVLHQNYPNPFFSSTGIVFEIPARMRVVLSIHDVSGRRVRMLDDSVREAGVHPLAWDGRDGSGDKVASGVYFLRLEAGGQERSIKIVRVH